MEEWFENFIKGVGKFPGQLIGYDPEATYYKKVNDAARARYYKEYYDAIKKGYTENN